MKLLKTSHLTFFMRSFLDQQQSESLVQENNKSHQIYVSKKYNQSCAKFRLL